jgi:hypothetical protein
MIAKQKAEWNKSTLFLLDSLQLDFNELIGNGLVNTYLCDFNHDVLHKNCIYLLFNPYKFTTNFESFCEKLRYHQGFVEEYDTNGEGKVMFVFKFPEKYTSIITNFIFGKYSKFDRNFVKEIYPQYVNGKLSMRWMIIEKHPEYKKKVEDSINIKGSTASVILSEDAEVYSIPNLKEEIYNYDEKIYDLWIK